MRIALIGYGEVGRILAEDLREAGLAAWSSDAAAERQGWVADLADESVFGAQDDAGFARPKDFRMKADRILRRVGAGSTIEGSARS